MQVAFGIEVLKKAEDALPEPCNEGEAGGLLHLRLGVCLVLPQNEKRLPVSRVGVIFVN